MIAIVAALLRRNQRQSRSFHLGIIATIASAALATLVACSGSRQGEIGYVEGFIGGIVADEPHAAFVGREVLTAGGSAADAAVAAYFTLAVTYPGAASLGGGGVCLIHDYNSDRTEALEFLARRPAPASADAPRPSAVPGNVRGMFALHARYGKLDWPDLLGPAVTLARDGHPISRAFAGELGVVAAALFADPAARAIFAQADGQPVTEGRRVRQLELAAVLSVLRTKGPGEFYVGALGHQIAAGARAAGGNLSAEDLRDYGPRFLTPIRVPIGDHVAVFTPAPPVGGVMAAQLTRVLTQHLRYGGASAEERPHVFAEAAARIRAGTDRWLAQDRATPGGGAELVSDDRLRALVDSFDRSAHVPPSSNDGAPVRRPEQPSAASLVVVDSQGQAVVCNFTMNYPFGTGRIAPGTGILLAASPGVGDRDASDLGAMLVVNENTGAIFYGAAASGGSAASSALAQVVLDTLRQGTPLPEAVAAQRIHHTGWPDIVLYEPGLGAGLRTALEQRGHQTRSAPVLGRVNAFHCPDGLPRQTSCSFVTDPRGHGLALSADPQ